MACKVKGIIARWTTPTIRYTPEAVDVSDIAEAEITIRQLGKVILHKTMEEAGIVEGGLLWSFTQEETGLMTTGANARVQIDFKTTAGVRYTTECVEFDVIDSAVSEVI